MRFFLLARARSTGLIRLLSDRAFDSRTAAVEAAGATASAIDLADDEVLAVDLDSAGPVLVLRVPVPEAVGTPAPGGPVVGPEAVIAPPLPATQSPGLFSPPASSSPAPVVSPFDEESAAWREYSFDEPMVRLQPRFPLFGADDEGTEEELSETLRCVARRMEADLTVSGPSEWAPVDDSWDARTLDDYAAPDDSHLSGAREEGRLRIDAAERLRADESTPVADADDRAIAEQVNEQADDRSAPSADPRCDDESPFASLELAEAGLSEDGSDAIAAPWDEAEAAPDESDLTVTQWDEALPEADAYTSGDSGVAEASGTTPFEVVPMSVTAAFDPELPPYSPANLDFAMWVCADCVYQRTCRQAGVSSPSKCGNFQWRSF